MKVHKEIVTDLYFKFVIDDFADITDSKFVKDFQRMKLNLVEARGLDHDLLVLLYKAKSRRHPDYFNGVVACGIIELLDQCAIVAKTPGLRKQIHYYAAPHTHGLGFDIKNINGQLSIIAVDTVQLKMFIETLETLINLLKLRRIVFQIIACQTRIESDEINCQSYTYVLLSQLAKASNIHEKIQTVPGIPQPSFYHNNATNNYHIQIADIKWIEAHHFPDKLAFATQSYIIMGRLLEAKNFRVSNDCEQKMHGLKEKLEYFRQQYSKDSDTPMPKNDYIQQRRQHISSFFTEKLCKSVISYRQQLKDDCHNLVVLLSKRPNDNLYQDIKQYLKSTLMPLKYQMELLQNLTKQILYHPDQIYTEFYIYKHRTWCLEQVEDLFMLRQLLLEMFIEHNISRQLFKNHILIDICIPRLLDFRNEDEMNCFRQDLTTGSSLVDRNHALLNRLLDIYGKQFVCNMSLKPFTNEECYIQVIAQLCPADLQEFILKFPNAETAQNNLKEVRSYLGLKIYDDDEMTVCAELDTREHDLNIDIVRALMAEQKISVKNPPELTEQSSPTL